MNKPTLWLLVGIPASGKSTAAASIVERNPNYIHISRDAIRYSMLGDEESYFAHEEDVFTEFCRQIQEGLNNGKNVFADATNLHWHSRGKLIRSLKLQDVKVSCLVFNTPIEVCIERNAKREGRACVPEYVIRSMYTKMTSPKKDYFTYDKICEWDGEETWQSM